MQALDKSISKKRTFSRPSSGKKSNARPKSANNFQMQKLERQVNQLRAVINVEKKFCQTVLTGGAFNSSATGQLALLNALSQGTSAYSRIGNSVKMDYLVVEGFVTLNTLTAQDTIKIALVIDKEPDAATTTYSDIWDNSSAQACIALRNSATVNRYHVLEQQIFTLSNAGGTQIAFKFYTKFPKGMEHIKFNNSSTGTIADIVTNALYITYGGSVAANFSTMNYFTRLRYIDN